MSLDYRHRFFLNPSIIVAFFNHLIKMNATYLIDSIKSLTCCADFSPFLYDTSTWNEHHFFTLTKEKLSNLPVVEQVQYS